MLYDPSSYIVLDEKSSYWSATKTSKFLAFHWSTSRSQAFIGQLLGTSRVVHLHAYAYFIEICSTDFDYVLDLVSADFSGPNHRIGQGCAGRA